MIFDDLIDTLSEHAVDMTVESRPEDSPRKRRRSSGEPIFWALLALVAITAFWVVFSL
ncbi:MAG: hypothetical protein AAGH57_11250 [Pseudomonadota bacterium]